MRIEKETHLDVNEVVASTHFMLLASVIVSDKRYWTTAEVRTILKATNFRPCMDGPPEEMVFWVSPIDILLLLVQWVSVDNEGSFISAQPRRWSWQP